MPEPLTADATLEQINKAIAEEHAAKKPDDAPDHIEVKLPTGQTYSGTKDEVIEKFRVAQENASLAIAERERENAEMRIRIAEIEAAKKKQATGDGFDRDKWLLLMEKDPVEAHIYINQHAYGPEMTPEGWSRTVATTGLTRNLLEITSFRNRVGQRYLESNESAEMLMRTLQASGRPITAENLESAWHYLVREGKMKYGSPDAEEEKPPKAPPSLGMGGGEVSPDIDQIAETMDLNKMREMLSRTRVS